MAGVQALEVIEGSNPIVAATFKAYNEYLPPTQEIARQRLKKAVDEFSTNASWVAGVLTSLKELVAAIKEAFKE